MQQTAICKNIALNYKLWRNINFNVYLFDESKASKFNKGISKVNSLAFLLVFHTTHSTLFISHDLTI
jgi:hypothetical protein